MVSRRSDYRGHREEMREATSGRGGEWDGLGEIQREVMSPAHSSIHEARYM